MPHIFQVVLMTTRALALEELSRICLRKITLVTREEYYYCHGHSLGRLYL